MDGYRYRVIVEQVENIGSSQSRKAVLRVFPPGLWGRATRAPNNQLYLDWFGWFKEDGPWIVHARMGRLYAVGEDTDDFYLYDPVPGAWLWTSHDAFPRLFEIGNGGGWIYFHNRGNVDGRWFFDYATRGWSRR